MADAPARRGRKEGLLDPASPAHRRAFAQALRDLRAECGNPAYRTLSGLSHCGSGSLSEAASGRRFPTWETTRGYVTGCLRHAQREDALADLLLQWRQRWETASALEETHRRRAADHPPGPVGEREPEREPKERASERGSEERASGREPEERAPGREPEERASGREPEERAPDGTPAEPVPGGPPPAAPESAAVAGAGADVGTPSHLVPPRTAVVPRPTPARWRPSAVSRTVAAAAVIIVLMTSLTGARAAPPQPHLTGLYNILVVPFARFGPDRSEVATGLESTLTRGLQEWSEQYPAVQVRGPDGIDPVDVAGRADRDRSLRTLAVEHNADIVLTGRLDHAGTSLSVATEIFVTDRTFAETPEFVGHHEISVTEPADVIGRNLAVGVGLTEGAVHYVKAIVAFVRGLGDYALDDFAGAEDMLRRAEEEFTAADSVTDGYAAGREVLYLMLGNTVGRRDAGRMAEAAEYYRRALSRNPYYPRAQIGLAEATRAAVPCEAGRDDADLRQAIAYYRAALPMSGEGAEATKALLRMKALLGLGLTYQCLAVSTHDDAWADANAAFAEVLRLYDTTPMTMTAGRQFLRLAAEARAGQALTALVTADRPDGARYGGHAAATAGYEEALGLLGRIDVARPSNLERELVFLRNLRTACAATGDAAKVADVDRRIATVGQRLARLNNRFGGPPE